MKTYLFALLLVLQANTTGVSVRVLDAEQEPRSGVRLTLKTYAYQHGEAFLIETQTCKTDTAGTCSLLLENPNTTGMQRGTLQIGDFGTRDLIWPGGMLTLNIPLAQLGFGRESAPYEFQAEDGGLVVHEKRFPTYALLMLLILGVLFWQVYQYAKTQQKDKA